MYYVNKEIKKEIIMGYKCTGILGMILGSMIFSLELYGLKIIQIIDNSTGIDGSRNPFHYFSEEPCIAIGFIITICSIICSFVVYLYGKELCNNKLDE